MLTKAELQAEIESMREQVRATNRQLKHKIDELEEERARFSVLATQDNSLMHLLDEILDVEVLPVETPHGVRWEDRKIVWGFYRDGEEIHRDSSLSAGYRCVWKLPNEFSGGKNE